jgi:PAS domain S-box-containing protein
VEADQKTLSLQQWSTRTLQEFCQMEGRGMHYNVNKAGVWADSLREGKPVVHNNYATLPNKKGMPEGHAPLLRELVVPVMQIGKVVAILGVGNKPEDYTEKDVETVSYLADVTWGIIEQKWAEEKILSSERRFRTLYQSMMDAFVVTDIQGRIRECNDAYSSMLGYPMQELRQLSCADITPEKWLESENKIIREQVLHRGSSSVYEKEYQRKDGTVFPVELRTFLLLNNDGKPEGLSAIVRDISERRRTEEEREKLQAQLNQAQKMESVGQLAGGVAHDFNNMRGVILGYTELALTKVNPLEPLHEYLQTIFTAAKRSAGITRQLLAFARKQTIAPKVLDLNDTVEGMLKMLRRLIGEDIDLAWLPETGLWSVKMDPSQVDQLLANLCVNARDAISGVGKVTIETDMRSFNEEYCADHPGFVPGDFILLAVSDDGCGMEKDVLDKVFEPFFTTKELGQGTGLGLSTVYGIVKQNNGFVNVYSEPGQGTTFRIYLPRFDGEHKMVKPEDTVKTPLGHGETVLVVEDEIAILELSRAILEELGYTVLTANTPSEAIRVAEMHAGKIHLLITDVIMPDLNGRDLARQLHSRYPALKTLFMSGYTANVIVHRGVLDEDVHFIQKPFSTKDFAIKVNEVLYL